MIGLGKALLFMATGSLIALSVCAGIVIARSGIGEDVL